MGAYVFDNLHLHDDEVEEFVRRALDPTYVRDGSVSDWEFAMRDLSRYIAQVLIDKIPELAPPDSRPDEER